MINKTQYGIRRLTLLNSGGFSRGEFPLDRSASISGSNNMGKTTAVNALQIPFLCDRREMQFAPGKSEKDTLIFYFPNTNSYVLSEVRTETGTFVVGAAGLGAVNGHEYQLFVYKKTLDLEKDFLYAANAEENQVNVRTLPELAEHLGEQDVWVKKLKPREMQEVLAGVRYLDKDSTIGVFRLENMSDLPLFMNIFKNLLRLNDFDMEKMKLYLLDTYVPRWGQTTRNFLEKYRHFDEEVRAERAKIKSARNISTRVRELVEKKEQWDQCYSFLSAAFKCISLKYNDAKKTLDLEIEQLTKSFENIEKEIAGCKAELAELDQKKRIAFGRKSDLEKRLTELSSEKKYFQAMSGQDTLFSRENIEAQIKSWTQTTEEIIANLAMSSGQDPAAIKVKIKEKEQAILRYQGLLKSLESNLVYELSDQLKQEEIQVLLKLFNKDILTRYVVNDGDFNVLEPKELLKEIKKVLSYCDGSYYNDGIITVNLAGIEDVDIEKYLNSTQVAATIKDLERDLKMLTDSLSAAIDRQKEEKRKETLKKKIKECEKELERHDMFLKALESEEVWKKELEKANQVWRELDKDHRRIDDKKDALITKKVTGDKELAEKKNDLTLLIQGREQVVPIRNFEGDLPDYEQLEPNDFNSWGIKDLVSGYVEKKEQALAAKNRISEIFDLIDSEGGRRFAIGDNVPARIDSLKNHTEPESIAKNEEILLNLQESHSVEIGAILKRFVNRLDEFKVGIRKFNRDMNKRKISNIKRLEFVIDDNNALLHTIKKLDKNLEKKDTLFAEQGSDGMIDRLIHIVESGQSITLPNMFNLSIAGELDNGKKFTSQGQSKIESNGTDLTIKVVLNVMLLKQILKQNAEHVLNIPAYIDEAGQIDPDNQEILIKECSEAGFVPIFASVEPQETAHYWVGLQVIDNHIQVTREDWWTIEDIQRRQEDVQAG